MSFLLTQVESRDLLFCNLFLFIQICRVKDGIELTEQSTTSVDLTDFRRQARTLIDRVRAQRANYGEKNKLHVDSDLGHYYYLYVNIHTHTHARTDLCFRRFVTSGSLLLMTLCERKYPKKLALIYLEELEREFTTSYSAAQIDAASTPFAFQSFETFMSKTKRLYEDSNSQRNVDQMAKVQSELSDVHRILSQNIHDMVERGSKIASERAPHTDGVAVSTNALCERRRESED
jgi:hypothetical protein